MRGQISAYKAPTHVVVMQPEEIPRTSTGKVKKNELRETLMARKAAE